MAYLLLLELLLHLLTLFLQGAIFLLESFDLEFQENKTKMYYLNHYIKSKGYLASSLHVDMLNELKCMKIMQKPWNIGIFCIPTCCVPGWL